MYTTGNPYTQAMKAGKGCKVTLLTLPACTLVILIIIEEKLRAA